MIRYEEHYNWQPDAAYEEKMLMSYVKIVDEKENGVSGYFTLGRDSLPLVDECEAYMAQTLFVRECKTIVIIGIGGSSLGTKAIDSMLKHRYRQRKEIMFLENPDEIDLSEKLGKLNKEETLVMVVSKSGTTIETISIFKEVLRYLAIDYAGEDRRQIVCITDKHSALHQFADYHGIKSFHIPANVGGRFSVLSAVGVVPLTLAGYDTRRILEGADAMCKRFFAGEEDHILKKAAFLTEHRAQTPMNVIFSYANCLEDFTKWYVQLWGESLGKIDAHNRHTGLTPIGHIGSVDQHSFLQLIMQGPRDKTVTFIKLENFEKNIAIPDIRLKFLEQTDYINGYSFNELIDGECEATKESVMAQGIQVDEITLDKIEEHNIGELIVYYELLTSACGIMLGINTYDQPGVELGKKILKQKFVS